MLLNRYTEKIKKRVDIFHYLKMLGKMKSMKEFMIKQKDELTLFDALTKNMFNVHINDNYDCSFLTKKKIHHKIQGIIAYLTNPEINIDEFIIDKFNEIL